MDHRIGSYNDATWQIVQIAKLPPTECQMCAKSPPTYSLSKPNDTLMLLWEAGAICHHTYQSLVSYRDQRMGGLERESIRMAGVKAATYSGEITARRTGSKYLGSLETDTIVSEAADAVINGTDLSEYAVRLAELQVSCGDGFDLPYEPVAGFEDIAQNRAALSVAELSEVANRLQITGMTVNVIKERVLTKPKKLSQIPAVTIDGKLYIAIEDAFAAIIEHIEAMREKLSNKMKRRKDGHTFDQLVFAVAMLKSLRAPHEGSFEDRFMSAEIDAMDDIMKAHRIKPMQAYEFLQAA